MICICGDFVLALRIPTCDVADLKFSQECLRRAYVLVLSTTTIDHLVKYVMHVANKTSKAVAVKASKATVVAKARASRAAAPKAKKRKDQPATD